MKNNLNLYVFLIKTALLADKPDMTLVLAAKYLLAMYDRSKLPDWLEATANANLDNWRAAVDEIRNMIAAEEKEPVA